MSPLRPSRNLAARMGRWSASHWKTATFGWLALVVVAVFLGGQVGTKNLDPQTSGSGESGRVDRIAHDEFPKKPSEMVFVQSRTTAASDPAFAATLADATRTLKAQSFVTNVKAPQFSDDHRSAMVQFQLRETDLTKAEAKSGPVEAAIAEQMVVTERAVEKHVTSIFGKLKLPPTAEDHRRVLAVLRYLRA
jgi:hypothetical protein